MDAPELSNTMSIYRIIGICVAFVILASVVSYCKNIFQIDMPLFSIWQPASIHLNEDETRSGPANITEIAVAPDSSVASADQTWCFLGEDMAGKWCIQVPVPNMCPVDRSFTSKNKCEGRSG